MRMYTIDELGDDTLDLDELIGRQLLFLEVSVGWYQSESSLSLSRSPLFSFLVFISSLFSSFSPFEKKYIHIYLRIGTEISP